MLTEVKKWGNSHAIRLPANIMSLLNLESNSPINLFERNGKIIIEPVKQGRYSLDSLLSEITTDNLHHEVDFGKPEGEEML